MNSYKETAYVFYLSTASLDNANMSEPRDRLTDPDNPPDDKSLLAWLGDEAYQLWTELAGLI